MIFEKLADGIMKHSKIIIAIWIVVLIASVPFVLKAGDVLSYDTNDMAGPNSESVEGMAIISEEFYSSGIDMNSTCLLVVQYSTETGETSATKVAELLNKDKVNYTAEVNGTTIEKLGTIMSYSQYPSDGSVPGIELVAIMYNDAYTNPTGDSTSSEITSKITDDTGNLRNFINQSLNASDSGVTEVKTYLTGSPAIAYDMEVGAATDISHIDVFSILLILILVGLFFRSFVSSAFPPITIGFALGLAFCALYFVGSVLNIFFITEMFIMVSMLGAGCDYCIFIIARYREERRNNKPHEEAMKEAIMWAGESITTSGLAVIIGFGAMSVCSFSLISNMGIMLAIGIIIALLAALTLITSILNIIGARIFWPSKISDFQEGSKSMDKGWYGKCAHFGHKYFVKSAAFSIKNAKLILVAALLFTVPMAYVYMTAESSYDMVGTMLTGDSQDGLETIEKYADGGMIMPDYVVLETNDMIATMTYRTISGTDVGLLQWSDKALADGGYLDELSTISTTLTDNDSNISTASSVIYWVGLAEEVAKGIPQGSMSDADYAEAVFEAMLNELPETNAMLSVVALVNVIPMAEAMGILTYNNTIIGEIMDFFNNYETGALGGKTVVSEGVTGLNYVKYTIITKEQSMSDRSMDSLTYIDNVFTKAEQNTDMFDVYWLTGTAAVMYDISGQVGEEFMTVEALAIILIFILLFFVMKSYLTPLRSILTILMSVVWTVAITHLLFGDLLGDGVIWMIPIILIVICLGLGMDYDILLTTRIKENRLHRGMTNDEAITEAVVNSGSVITICGLIMGGAFGTLMLSSMTLLTEFGFALAFAIIVDALVVRTYIVPAVMHLMGDWCWKGPKFLHKKTTLAEENKE